jgi:hypothetical protein
LGAVAGVFAAWVSGLDAANAFWNGITIGLALYVVSFYLARYAFYRRLGKEYFNKIYTTGIGGFVMIFLFTWILLFTLAL